MENKKTIKQLENIINEKIYAYILKYRERNHESKKRGFFWSSGYISAGYESVIFSPINNYKIKELKDNKPNTLLAAKKDAKLTFVCFATISCFNHGEDNIKLFDVNDNKKTVDARGIVPQSMGGCARTDPRKQEGRKFIITNKNATNYLQAYSKHIERAKHRESFTGWERWNACKQYDIEVFDNLNYRVFHNWHRITPEEIDKSGYFKPFFTKSLNERLDKLKAERENQRREKAKAQFIASDKSEHLKIIDELIKQNQNIILSALNRGYNFIMSKGAIYLLSELRDNIAKLNKIKNSINDYARWQDPTKELINDILEVKENYIITLTKFNNYDLKWCQNGCYMVKGGEVIARYNWVGQAGTIHADEVSKCSICLDF